MKDLEVAMDLEGSGQVPVGESYLVYAGGSVLGKSEVQLLL